MGSESRAANLQMVKLSDLGEVNRGRSRHRPRYAEHLYGGPYPFIQTGDIKQSGGRITHYEQTYSEAGLAQSRLWPEGTMAITIAANIAETAILTFPACFPDSVIGFIPDKSKCDVRFIEYTFRHLKRRIQHEATGSVQDNINLGTLDRLEFSIPPLPEQQAIASILGALDDKIELNRRMNETLESMARAIFKSWFVDFDPVRAKMDGRQPTGMDQATADLFPDAMEHVDGELIPKGWRFAALSDVADLQSGGTPKKSNADFWNGDIPWISPKSMMTIHARDSSERVTGHAIGNGTRIVPRGSVLVMVRGMGLHQGVRISQARCDLSFNQDVKALVPTGVDGAFLLFALLDASPLLFSRVQSSGHGTGVLPTDLLLSLEFPVPQTPGHARLVEPLQKMNDRIASNSIESQTLVSLRDTLLPKLLSGEIRVGDAEKAVEAVA